MDGEPPTTLSAATGDDGVLAIHMVEPGKTEGQVGTISIARRLLLWQGTCYERTEVTNFDGASVTLHLQWEFGAGYDDLFEVRGMRRHRRGELHVPDLSAGEVALGYLGLDGVTRRTRIQCDSPTHTDSHSITVSLDLAPGEARTVDLRIICEIERTEVTDSFDVAIMQAQEKRYEIADGMARFVSDSDSWNDWIDRSTTDLQTLLTRTPHGLYPYAGIPWYSTPFGRDGIITALETLALNPRIAAGVLRYLAATQATEEQRSTGAQPGKIMHETRLGEMANLGEHPFQRYYGTIDATPLFVMLAGEYFDWTADRELLDEIWPNIAAALAWIDAYGDLDGDGFIEYAGAADGLVNQGWQDSVDSIFHADGSLATGPIAVCEAQGYVYAARRAAARIALVLGDEAFARAQFESSRQLQLAFDTAFWDDGLRTFTLALDGNKRPCRVVSSNAGHGLFSDIVLPERRQALATSLLSPEMFSGWGVRTKSSASERFNPMSYHNGAVWPHDTALIGAGLARAGFQREAATIATALIEASRHLDRRQMPELYCGFAREAGAGPVGYPVACLPQAWSAAAVFMLLSSAVGFKPEASTRTLRLQPQLPAGMNRLDIRQLPFAGQRLDLHIERSGNGTDVEVRPADTSLIIVVDTPQQA